MIGSIDAAVLHFTLKICGLEYAELCVLPLAPFVAFLLLLNGGYFVGFTAAGGQSIGKMIAGVKVVPAGDDGVDRSRAARSGRSAGRWLPGVRAAGGARLSAGALSADKRAVHDRLAHTRVIKA